MRYGVTKQEVKFEEREVTEGVTLYTIGLGPGYRPLMIDLTILSDGSLIFR